MSFDLGFIIQFGPGVIAIVFCGYLLYKIYDINKNFAIYKVTITGELKDYVTYQNLKSSIEESFRPYLQEIKHIQEGLKELKETLKEMTFGKIDKK